MAHNIRSLMHNRLFYTKQYWCQCNVTTSATSTPLPPSTFEPTLFLLFFKIFNLAKSIPCPSQIYDLPSQQVLSLSYVWMQKGTRRFQQFGYFFSSLFWKRFSTVDLEIEPIWTSKTDYFFVGLSWPPQNLLKALLY